MATGEIETSSENSVGRANINITTNGNYTQISQGQNQQISYQGEKKFAGGPSFNMNIDGQTHYYVDGYKAWTFAKKFDFNFGRHYRIDEKASFTVGKQTSVENETSVLFTAGQSLERKTKLEVYKRWMMQLPGYATYFKYLFKIYRWSQFITKPVVGPNSALGYTTSIDNKKLLDSVEGFVNGPVSLIIKYFQSIVSTVNLAYFQWLLYEKLFHKPNVPKSILQLSSEKGVLLAGGDPETINGIEMKESIHLSCYKKDMSLRGLANRATIYKNIYKPRDVHKDAEGIGDRLTRWGAQKTTGGKAGQVGKAEAYGEFNGLKDEYIGESFLNVGPKTIRTKTIEHSTIAQAIKANSVTSETKSTECLVSGTQLVRFNCGSDRNGSVLTLNQSGAILTAGNMGLVMTRDELILDNYGAQSSVSVRRDGITVSKGSESQILIEDDKIEISNNSAKISVTNNSVSIGSELKVMNVSVATRFRENELVKNKLKELKRKYKQDVQKADNDRQEILNKINASENERSAGSQKIWEEFEKLNSEMDKARKEIANKSDKLWGKK